VRRIDFSSPWRWLALGWQDMRAAPLASLLHGIVAAIGGLAILWLGSQAWLLLPGALSGFVLVAPILATGLYELSRRRAAGETPTLNHVFAAWRRGTRPLIGIGIILAVLGTLWVLASALLFTLFIPTPLHGPAAFIRYAAVEQGALLFTLWAILGGLGVAIVFALTAVSPPLLLGRVVGLRRAMLTSVRAVGENPMAMLVWALIILTATALSLATAMLGFLVSVPVLGHASWHAYRELVVTDGVALRNGGMDEP